MTVAEIGARLKPYTAMTVDEPTFSGAAVAVVLRDREAGAEFIAIHRAHRVGDPWSGHMALPGGRRQESDSDLFETAARETFEEIGVDLRRDGEALGRLDDVRAVGRGRPMNLIIRPFVCGLRTPVELIPNHSEVQSALWIPVASLNRRDVRGTYRHTILGQDFEHPAFLYEGHTIWGLTHRILCGLLDILGQGPGQSR